MRPYMSARNGYRGYLRWPLILLAVLLCQGCAYLGLLQHTYSELAVPAQRFEFQDGGHAIYFALDKSLLETAPGQTAPAPETYLFVIGGSDCASMQYFLPHYFRGLEGESGPLRIYILQKRVIEARTWGRVWGCSDAFIRADHPGRWIDDQTAFIQAQLLRATQFGRSPKRVVIIGISEGGDIVPIVVKRIKRATHAVILGNGGMDPIDAYRLQAKNHGFSAGLDLLKTLEQPVPADPDAIALRIAGRTWRYWSELQQVHHTDNLLSLDLPLLIAMGEADQLVPIESARYLQRRFTQAGKSNLTFLTYADADHALQAGAHSYLPDFWHALDLWLEQ